jgi:hypothetical protein
VKADAAEAFFIAGGVVVMAAGALHIALALIDGIRPSYFVPRDRALRPAMEGVRMRYGGRAAPSMWSVWRGIHLTHGLGIFTFGLLCLVIASYDFGLVTSIDVIRPLTIVVAAAYLAVSLRFFFYGPAVITGAAMACFAIATALSA